MTRWLFVLVFLNNLLWFIYAARPKPPVITWHACEVIQDGSRTVFTLNADGIPTGVSCSTVDNASVIVSKDTLLTIEVGR